MNSKQFTRRLVGISALMLLMTAAGAAGYRLIGGPSRRSTLSIWR